MKETSTASKILIAGVVGSLVTAGLILSRDKNTRRKVTAKLSKTWGMVASNGALIQKIKEIIREFDTEKLEKGKDMAMEKMEELSPSKPVGRPKAVASP